jgi:hypothetical protein
MKLFKKIIGYFLLLNLIPGLFILYQFSSPEHHWTIYYVSGWLINIGAILIMQLLVLINWLIED